MFRLDVTPEQAQALAIELSKAADAGLFHPSIVEPVAAGVEGTVAYRAEEYVAAESLDVAIRHYAPAALDKALPFITQLAGAIDFARAAGVGHGALHLRDVFVTPEEARASGFGVVEALERVGLRAPVRRPYSAPERIAGQPWSTPADVFSLAAIAFELLTGRRPSGTGERIGALSGDNLGAHADMLHVVLARAMSDDPALRHPSALSFASALEAAARGERVTGAMEQVGAISSMVTPPAVAAAGVPHHDVGHDVEDNRHLDDEVALHAEPEFEESAAALLLDREPADDPFDDVASEREFDETHAVLLAGEAHHEADDHERTLFDHDEAAEDLALEPPPRFTGVDPPIVSRRPDDREDDYPSRDDLRAAAAEPPRRAVLPLALTLILGLLVGFAAGYAVGGRGAAPLPVDDTTADSGTAQGTPQGPAGAASSDPGRPFSEQAVAPPAGTPPPVVPDAPPVADREPARPRTGRLLVRSTPSNANVSIDGSWRGRTPFELGDLGLGAYSVRVVQDGYVVSEQQVRLTPSTPERTVNVRLVRSRAAAAPAPRRPAASSTAPARPAVFLGSIFVDSRPRGARVTIDGKAVGVTPLRLADVGIGSHVVRLELDDHRAWTTSTRVAAGEEARVTGSLERIR